MQAPNRDRLAHAAFDSYPGARVVSTADLEAQKLAILIDMCAAINVEAPPNFGLLVKTDQGGKIPSDIVIWSDTMEHFDLLSDRQLNGDQNEILYAGWNSKGIVTNAAWVWKAVPAAAGVGQVQTVPTGPMPDPYLEQLRGVLNQLGDVRPYLEQLRGVLNQLGDVLKLIAEQIDGIKTEQTALAAKVDALGKVENDTAANVSEALAIAREIQGHTATTAGTMNGVVDQVHNVTQTVGTVASQLGPLLKLLGALRG